MIPRLKPTLGLSEILAALRVGRRGDVERFEQAFARLMGQERALAFPYGRTGLNLLLEALGLKGKEIICPAYTCVVVPHAIMYSGNRPVFVDCAAGEFNMDLDRAEAAISDKTGAIIATSIFGYPVDLDRLDQLKARHPRIPVIQDCAHSFAAQWKGRPVQKEGAAAVFGLNISKLLTSVFGGMITTDDPDLYDRLKAIRQQRLASASWMKSLRRLLYLAAVYPTFTGLVYGAVNRLERSHALDHFVQYYDETQIDMPGDHMEQMCALEARVGAANIARCGDIIRNRREAAEHYFDVLSAPGAFDRLNQTPGAPRVEVPGDFILPPRVKGATYSHFAVRVPDREKWLQWGLKNGVQLGWLIEYNIPEMTAYADCKGGPCPEASAYSRQMINLPVWGGRAAAETASEKLSVLNQS